MMAEPQAKANGLKGRDVEWYGGASRFELELEVCNELSDLLNQIAHDEHADNRPQFAQALSNPLYVQYLATQKYFEDENFIRYLDYLQYFREPRYLKFLQ